MCGRAGVNAQKIAFPIMVKRCPENEKWMNIRNMGVIDVWEIKLRLVHVRKNVKVNRFCIARVAQRFRS